MSSAPTPIIMVADDDAAILEATTLFLEMKNFQVKPIEGGDVFAACLEQAPDLLLLDIWMSGVDGREVCKKIKADNRTKEIPIILFSAGNDVGASAMQAGADGFLEKPFDVESLLRTIEGHLDKK